MMSGPDKSMSQFAKRIVDSKAFRAAIIATIRFAGAANRPPLAAMSTMEIARSESK
jgi:hypothetical protein